MPIDWAKINESMQARREGTMPINPKYAEIVNRSQGGGGGDREKLPAIWLNNIGDAFSGTVVRVSDIKQLKNTHPQAKSPTYDAQFVDLKDATVRSLDPVAGEFVEKEMPAATFMIGKVGMFEAVLQALMELNERTEGEGYSDIPVGAEFKMRRGANDDKKYTFNAKLTTFPF